MLTRLSPDLPVTLPVSKQGNSLAEQVANLWSELEKQRDHNRRLTEALVAWHERLNQYGMLAIEGGLIDNTPIGGTTAAAGEFTTLDASGALSIGNTVNVVAPTAPNRTVTIVIGGTTYYLHAKTTND